MLGHTQYKIMFEMYVLARNMGWPDGLELILLWHGVGSNLGGLKFNFFLLKGCVAEYEKMRETLGG